MLNHLPLQFINRLLAAEPWAAELLAPHAGQTARLELGGFTLRFTVGADQRLQTAAPEAADTTILRVPTEALGALLDGPQALMQHAHIEGNAAFAETLGRLLQHLRPDLGAYLAPHVGDILAHRIASTAGSLGRQALTSGRVVADAVTRMVRDETGLVLARNDFQTTGDALAELDAALAACAERVARLEASATKSSS